MNNNLNKLFENSKLVQSKLKNDRNIIIEKIIPKDDHILFTGKIVGEDKEYDVELQLFDLNIPIDVNNCKVKVFCSCPSFQFRNEKYLNEVDALADGHEVREYEKKTSKKSMNPDKLPSVCKHIYQFALKLEEIGNLKNLK